MLYVPRLSVLRKALLTLNSAPMENSAQTESVLSARTVIVLFRSGLLGSLAGHLAAPRIQCAMIATVACQSRVHREQTVPLDLPA